MSKELEIFKKHLGEVQTRTEFNAKQLCTQINDANDFIGALQILDLNLKKIQKNLKERIEEPGLNEDEKRSLDASNAQLVNSCLFLGNSLFDNNFTLNIAANNFSFEIQNPLLILQKAAYEDVLAYIEDKREEIDKLLLDLASALSFQSLDEFAPKTNDNFTYKNIFKN